MFAPLVSRSGGGGGGGSLGAASRQPTLAYMLGLMLAMSLTAWWWSSAGSHGHDSADSNSLFARQRPYTATRPHKGGAGAQAAARARMLALTSGKSAGTPADRSAAVTGTDDGEDVSAATTCTWQFSHYTASSWESEWFKGIADVQDTRGGVCAKIAEKPAEALLMIQQIGEWHAAQSTPSQVDGSPGTEIMSRMHYKLVCSPSSASASAPAPASASSSPPSEGEVVATGFQLIEPLVGLLRDPLCLCAPLPGQGPDPPGHDQVHSKRFLLPMAYAPYQVTLADNAPQGLAQAIQDVVKGSGLSPW